MEIQKQRWFERHREGQVIPTNRYFLECGSALIVALKQKLNHFLCSNPSFKSKINSSKLIKGGLGTRLSQDYYDDS